MATQFPEWIAQLGRDGLLFTPPAIRRGVRRTFSILLAEHPYLGDWTDGVFECQIRSAPDAAGDPLAAFTVTVGTPSDSITQVQFDLEPEDQADLPPDDGEGVIRLPIDVVYTPTGESGELVGGGMIAVLGAVTQ